VGGKTCQGVKSDERHVGRGKIGRKTCGGCKIERKMAREAKKSGGKRVKMKENGGGVQAKVGRKLDEKVGGSQEKVGSKIGTKRWGMAPEKDEE